MMWLFVRDWTSTTFVCLSGNRFDWLSAMTSLLSMVAAGMDGMLRVGDSFHSFKEIEIIEESFEKRNFLHFIEKI